MQQALKPASGAARAHIVAAELFRQLDLTMDEAASTLDMGFRGEGLPPLTRDGESRGGRRRRDACALQPPLSYGGAPPGPRFYHGALHRDNTQGGHHLVTNDCFLRQDMINQPPHIVRTDAAPVPTQWRKSRGGRMTDSRDAGGAHVVGRNTLSALCVVAMLTTLGACAAENATGVATSAPATAPSPAAPAASPVAASTTIPAAPKAPHVLTPTEINEQCWMSNEVNKMKDLDAKAKYVDKCVADRMKAEGM